MEKRSRKHVYRALHYQKVDWSTLTEVAPDERVVLGIDVAKTTMYAVAMDARRQVLITFKWDLLSESRQLIGLLCRLPLTGLQCAMEPSGTYGDPLRELLWEAGVPVFRVNPKRSHDFTEVYDGVPSSHDAKAAALVAYLHWAEMSEPWPRREEGERALVAAVRTMTAFDAQLEQGRNRLEAQLARHWPELLQLMELDGAVMLELLMEFGSPSAVSEQEEEAAELMRRIGGRFLKPEKVESVLASARSSLGVPMVAEESRALAELARETRRLRRSAKQARHRVESLARRQISVRRMGEVVGLATAAVLVATAGNPTAYPNAASWLKSLGLNLKERSSGTHKGRLSITKRGPGLARKYQFLAVLRWLKDQPLARAWYERKVGRDGGLSRKALVALMRKSAGALWWVARGAPFDPEKLFDRSRLAPGGETA